MNHGGDEKPTGIGNDMTLAPLDLLARVEPARAAAFRGIYRLAVDRAGRGVGVATFRFTRPHAQFVIDPVQCPVPAPGVELPLNRAARRKILRQKTPLAARPHHIEVRVYHRAHLHRPRPAQTLLRRQQRANHVPFRVRQIACISQARTPILGSSGLCPHRVSPSLLSHNEGITSD